MNKMNTSISIDKIEVSISGLTNEIVKRSFVHIDKELSLQANKLLQGKFNEDQHLSAINVGNLPVHHDIQPVELRRMIAERILTSISIPMVQESL